MQVRDLYITHTEGSSAVYEQQLDEIAPAVGAAALWLAKWAAKRAILPGLKWLVRKIVLPGAAAYGIAQYGIDKLKDILGEEVVQMLLDNGWTIALIAALVIGGIVIKRWVGKHGEDFADRWTNSKTEEAFEESLSERQVWAKSGKKVVRKYRCTSGPRKGRTVAKMAQCFAAPDVKKRMSLKRTKARLGKRIARKARKTKRINPASMRVARLNKRGR
jgi:hypothetical protein